MPHQEKCIDCQCDVRSGKFRNFVNCRVCNTVVCSRCSQLGLCREHFSKLSSEQITKLKKVNYWGALFSTIVPISIIGILFYYFGSPIREFFQPFPYSILMVILVFLGFLYGLMLAAFLFREKRMTKVCDPLRALEGYSGMI